MIRNVLLFLVVFHFGHNGAAQYDGISLNKTSLMDWAVQQQLVLNEQPGKKLVLSIEDGTGNSVVYTYKKLNDSIYREVVKESNVAITVDQLYIKRGNMLTACYPLKDGYTDRDFSGYRDSMGYLVRDTIVTKRGKSPFHRRDVVLLDSNYTVAEWWTYDDGMDSVFYRRESKITNNCFERQYFYITKTDSIKSSFLRECEGKGAEFLLTERVFLGALDWELVSKRKIHADDWIVPSNRKGVFYLIDFAAEPRFIRGKLVKDDEVKIKTDKKGCIKQIKINTFLEGNSKTAWLFWLDE